MVGVNGDENELKTVKRRTGRGMRPNEKMVHAKMNGRTLDDVSTCNGSNMVDGCTVHDLEPVMGGKNCRKKQMRTVKIVRSEPRAKQKECQRNTTKDLSAQSASHRLF